MKVSICLILQTDNTNSGPPFDRTIFRSLKKCQRAASDFSELGLETDLRLNGRSLNFDLSTSKFSERNKILDRRLNRGENISNFEEFQRAEKYHSAREESRSLKVVLSGSDLAFGLGGRGRELSEFPFLSLYFFQPAEKSQSNGAPL